MSDVSAQCECGHAKGHHLGGNDSSCTSAWGCDCEEFEESDE